MRVLGSIGVYIHDHILRNMKKMMMMNGVHTKSILLSLMPYL